MAEGAIDRNEGWVREFAFGIWFLNSWMWIGHVLGPSLYNLEIPHGPQAGPLPRHSRCRVRPRPFTVAARPAFSSEPDHRPRRGSQRPRLGPSPKAARCRGKVEFLINNAAAMDMPEPVRGHGVLSPDFPSYHRGGCRRTRVLSRAQARREYCCSPSRAGAISIRG